MGAAAGGCGDADMEGGGAGDDGGGEEEVADSMGENSQSGRGVSGRGGLSAEGSWGRGAGRGHI